MKSYDYMIVAPTGFHARPAAMLVQCCSEFKSQVTVSCDGKKADGKSILQLTALSAKYGQMLNVTAEGEDEDKAIEAIKAVLVFHEDKADTKELKIAFFGTKDYDKTFFTELTKEKGQGTYNSDITFFNARLTAETVSLAQGFDAVCIFVNDDCSTPIVEKLNEYGVKLILLRCAGFNNVDLKKAKEFGMTVLRVPAYSPYAVAEHGMAILQQCNRRLHKAYNKVKDNNFALSGLLGVDLHNKVAGILGTGRIGQCMANICKGYGMTVIAWDAYPNQSLVDSGLLTYVSKEELYQKADLISLHAPLIMGENGTYHLLDDEALGMMKDTAMIVNTARGPLIDTEALIKYLKQGKFHAVALDVYEGEDENVYTDRSDENLSSSVTARINMFPNVVMTSHQAFFTSEALQAIATVTMENARNFNEKNNLGPADVIATMLR